MNRDLALRLDSAQRREPDDTRKLALCVRLQMERENAPAAYKARQDARLRDLNRVRVQGGRA